MLQKGWDQLQDMRHILAPATSLLLPVRFFWLVCRNFLLGTADPVLILSSINPRREIHVFDFLDSLNKVTGILRVPFQMVSFSLFKGILKHYFGELYIFLKNQVCLQCPQEKSIQLNS